MRIAELLGGASVVYLHGIWEPLLLATAAEARAASIPYVVVPVGMLDPWSLAQKKWKKRAALAIAVRAMLNRAAAIRALNRDEADLIRPLGLKAPMRVIPNGVNLSEIDTPVPENMLARTLPAVAGRPYIFFLSRLHYKKGLDLLADAFALIAPDHPDVQLVVAGPDDGERAAFEQRIADLRLTDRVHLPGPLYGTAKWAAIRGAACFCLPSRQEGFSLAILEALASRLPVVISEGCHFPEVSDAASGVVTPLDSAEVAAGLNRVLSDPTEAMAMGTAGRRLVEERYTWDKVAAMCEDLDEEVIMR
jgi:glycosyltransferase involved in cell wall biosynthesis